MTTDNKEINLGYLFLGFFIFFFGLIMLASCLNIIIFNVNLWNLLPIFIVAIGLSFLSSRKPGSIFLLLGAILVVMLATILSLLSSAIGQGGSVYNSSISVLRDADAQEANITINAGAGDVNIFDSSISGYLVSGDVYTDFSKIDTETKTENGIQNVKIDFNGARKMFGTGFKNQLNLGLATDIPVALYLNIGASNSSIDLSSIEAKKVVLTSGASTIDLKLGSRIDMSDIQIEGGASSITMDLPEDAGVKLNLTSGLSSNELTGFTKTNGNEYQSDNYSASAKSINVSVKMGVSNFTVNWYKPESLANIQLFYYKQSADTEVSCDKQFIMPVNREIPESDNMIRDAINLLIKGQITAQEKAEGFTTEFPNKDFKLINADLKDGILSLTFTEVPGFSDGGSCRIMLMAQQVIKTANQFPGVERVVFYPESIFQP